ncbi:YybH family protein [Hyphobacterium sp.]|uniref:YybH family protein n=1 Tax=Hyphobacterium sp. TaxID=2004662 RepID=UPI003BA9C64C
MTVSLLVAGVLAMTAAQVVDSAVEGAMQADRDFAAYAAQHGVAAGFRRYATDDARLIQPNTDDIVGPDAIYAAREGATGLLHWEPRGGYAGAAGDFAVTYGDWSYHPDAERDSPPSATGNYVSVWRLTGDGWRYVLDTGNVNTPPPDLGPD